MFLQDTIGKEYATSSNVTAPSNQREKLQKSLNEIFTNLDLPTNKNVTWTIGKFIGPLWTLYKSCHSVLVTSLWCI
jgi:hypothetical protein